MKLSNVNTYAKKISMCIEHIDRYKQFKVLKEAFKKMMSGESMNSLSKDDIKECMI
jgi:hypothetical protein